MAATAPRPFTAADRDRAIALVERGLCESYERAVAQVTSSTTATAAEYRCWTRMHGGRWTCVASGTRERCYDVLAQRVGGSVTGVVLPASERPKDDDPPPQPPAQSAAVPAAPRPPTTPTGQYARSHGPVAGESWEQMYARQLANVQQYQRQRAEDPAAEEIRRTPPSPARLMGAGVQARRAVPAQFSREDRDRAILLCETQGIDFATAVERVRRAG